MNKIYLTIRENGKEMKCAKLLSGKEYYIGRDKNSADIVLSHPRVSRNHCCIKYDAEEGCIWIKDMSSNGCRVNGQTSLIQNVFMRTELGDEISFCNTEITMRVKEVKSILPWILLMDVILVLLIILLFMMKDRQEEKVLEESQMSGSYTEEMISEEKNLTN